MLAVLSPAKKLDFGLPTVPMPTTSPLMLRHATRLVKVARSLSAADLKRLMKLSDKLAELNHDRFQSFASGGQPRGSKQAALAFNGDTYQGLAAWEFNESDFEFAQSHVGILSGLYGLLRPLDAIQPYRLEMGTRLTTDKGRNLYDYWGSHIARRIDAHLADHRHRVVVNLASTEYFEAVKRHALRSAVLTMVFQEFRQGERKVIGLFAKRARGSMARFIVQNRIQTPEALKGFEQDGYRFDAGASTEESFVFLRKS